MMTKKRIRSVIILAGILLVSVVWLVINGTKDDGERVVIALGGEIIQEMSLNVDASFLAGSKEGDYNLIVVEDGKAYVSEANCANQICKNSKSISKSGEVITCIPHRLVVTIVSPEKEVDAVAY